jgi:hypothetical protein
MYDIFLSPTTMTRSNDAIDYLGNMQKYAIYLGNEISYKAEL